ncbi:S-layer homology domain-containing protein [Dysosmobacter sp.]|uniref:S-layer homology domain-containing protein n=1 Tax=Dysosmobacter sp. TaxID=2591382 RepID=UPI003AB16394
MKKRILSCLMALALCLTLLPTAALAEETEGTAQTPPAVEEPADPANGEAKQEKQPAAPEQESQPAEAKRENQSAEQEEQQENSTVKQDEAVATVQAMIDDLPDAEELDGMDDEAQESACLAASEAYEAYDALTEDQQSALTGAEKMIAILEWTTEQVALAANEDLSSHTNHDDWTAISTATELTGIDKAGNYYLTDNVTLTENEAWKPADGVVLCLNGKSIQASGNFDVITVNNGVTFTLCDCKSSGSTGKVTHSNGTGSGVYVNGTFNMYGGSISGNSAIYGGGVRIERTIKNPVFNMYGGEITNNKAASSGGFGGGVYVNGTFTMSGGSITKNTVSDTKGIYYGGGVYVSESATFTVSGTVNITGNTAENGNANNVFLPFGDQSLKSFTIGEAGLAPGSSIGVATNMAPDPGYHLTVATLSEGAAYIEGTIISDRTGGYAIKAKGNNINLYNGLPHEHYRCNGKDVETGGDKCTGIGGHTEEGVLSFKAWTSATKLPTTSGEYYLTKDVTLDSAWSIKSIGGEQVRFVLCLNGHSIRLKAGVNDYVINVGAGGTLALCDCNGSKAGNGTITGSTKASGVYIDKAGAFVMYGGSISGNGTGVTNKDLFQMYGGSITGNDCGVDNLTGTFTMYDGSIVGNQNTKNNSYGKGGGVCVESGAFDMHGGSITGNAVSGSYQSYGGGVFVDSGCRFTMDGGSITGNTAGDYGGGVYVNSTAFTVSGDVTISGNTASSKTSNVYLESGKSITVGGKLTGRAESIGVTTASAPAENSYLTIANGVKYTLTEDDLKAFASDSTYGKQLNGNSVIFTNGDLHIHAVCGESCTHNGAHSNAVWKPLTYNAETKTLYYGGTAASKESKGFYKLPAGNYYLTGNITVDNYIDITGDVNLCLNGKTLSTSLVNTTGQNIAFILVDQNRTLTLCDCDPNGAGTIQTENTLTYGVQTGASGKLAMYGGKITGVECGVYAADQFAMYGGTITGTKRGVYAPKQFAMYGGTITGNTEYGVRPGDTATMIVGGDAKIESNATNVDLCAATITIDESLTQDARIGVRLLQNDVPAGTAKKQFATGANSSALNYGAIFSCDNGSKYVVSKDTDGKLHFALHQHSWSYKADGATITAHCVATGCSLEDGLGGTLTLVPPTNPTYDGQVKRPEIKSDQAWNDNIGAWKGASTYDRNGINVDSPIDAGEYKARYYVTGGENAVAEVTYTIAKATPKLEWNGYPYGKSFTGSAIVPPTASEIRIHDGSNNALDLFDKTSFKWYTADKTPLDGNPIDAGDYIIEAEIAATDNTNAVTIEKNLTVSQKENLGNYDTKISIVVPMYPSATKQEFDVYLAEELTKQGVRHGGSLEPNTDYSGISFPSSHPYFNSGSWEDGKVIIKTNPTTGMSTGGTIVITANMTSRNYKVIPVEITLTLQEKPTANDITVSMGDWTYGGTANAPVYTVPAGVTAEVTYAAQGSSDFSTTVPTNAGSYTVKVQYATDTEIHTGTANFTISKREIAVPTEDPRQFEYTGQEQTYVLSNFADAAYYTVSDTMKRTEAGSQNVTVQLKDKNNTVWKGGTDADKTYVFTIAPKPLSKVTIGDFPDKTYTGLSIQPVVVPVDGNTALTEDTDYTVSYGANTNVGKATITVTGTGNYTGTVCKEWNIIPAVLIISGVTVADKTYNGSADATVTAVAFNGLKNGEKLEIGTDYEVIGAAFNDENVDTANKVTGTVALKVTGTAKNYTLSSTAFEQAAAIGQADYTGTASTTVNIVKGRSTAQIGTLTAADFFPEGQMPGGAKITAWSLTSPTTAILSAVSVGGGKLTYLSAKNIATASEESGSVTIATTNYKDITATLTFHPTDKLVQDGFKFENGSVTKTYGDEDFTLTATGEVKGSTVTYESSEPAVATVDGTGKVTIKGAGTAVITAKASATEEYDAAAATCTLTVEKKPIAIPTADATVFTYNGTEQTYALAEDGAYTITGNKQTNANEMGYSVTAALKDTANTQWADGTTANKTYTFVIGKAVITVKAKDQTAYVGDKAPTLGADSYTVSGLVGEEKLTTQPTVKYVGADGSEIAPDMTKTGEVKILAGGAAASDNYTIRYEDGKLTVSTRPSGGGGSSRPSTHPVQAEVSKDPDGSVSLSKANAAKGDKVTITVKPERHYEVDEVIVRDSKGKQLAVKDNGDGTFTFEMPADKVTVEPTFSWVNPFADVANSAYYVDAVEWMLKREVTQGTTETTFSPNLNCTRAQIVTFLWRAAGSPEPKGTVSFADVSAGSYYAKAVAWAIENGITGGTGDGLFSPDATCTRAQSAAFLYRAAGSPAVGGSAGFSDVAADAYYAQAVAWTKEHGITDGIGGGLFGSANGCTRAQIAAFLWRLYAEK